MRNLKLLPVLLAFFFFTSCSGDESSQDAPANDTGDASHVEREGSSSLVWISPPEQSGIEFHYPSGFQGVVRVDLPPGPTEKYVDVLQFDSATTHWDTVTSFNSCGAHPVDSLWMPMPGHYKAVPKFAVTPCGHPAQPVYSIDTVLNGVVTPMKVESTYAPVNDLNNVSLITVVIVEDQGDTVAASN